MLCSGVKGFEPATSEPLQVPYPGMTGRYDTGAYSPIEQPGALWALTVSAVHLTAAGAG